MSASTCTEGSDGFNVMFPYLPEGLDDLVGKVFPELQRCGIFRRAYTGGTLRDHLGLPRPGNQFFDSYKVECAAIGSAGGVLVSACEYRFAIIAFC